MSIGGKLALAAVEQVAATAGLRAGLVALRRVVDELSDPRDRARAIELGFTWASESEDESTLTWLCDRWIGQPGERLDELRALLPRLRHRPDLVRALVDAQCIRAPDDPRSFYLRARVRPDRVGQLADLRTALRLARARNVPTGAIEARLARLGVQDEVEDDTPRARLAALREKLAAGGRYKRVAALDGLAELVAAAEAGRDEAVRDAAAAALAEHADSDPRLTEIELDRIRTALARWPDEAARAAALGRLAAHARLLGAPSEDPLDEAAGRALDLATSVLEHHVAGSPDGPPDLRWRALDAIAGVRGGTPDVSERYERLASAAQSPDARLHVAVLTACWVGAAHPDDVVRRCSQRLMPRLLELPGRRPSRGWARAASVCEDPALRPRLLEAGRAAGDPEARSDLAAALVRTAWQEAAEGRRDEALARLRRARAMLK